MPQIPIQSIKRYGDKGSPCLVSLDGSKRSKAPPLTKIGVLEDVTQLMIILEIFGENLEKIQKEFVTFGKQFIIEGKNTWPHIV